MFKYQLQLAHYKEPAHTVSLTSITVDSSKLLKEGDAITGAYKDNNGNPRRLTGVVSQIFSGEAY